MKGERKNERERRKVRDGEVYRYMYKLYLRVREREREREKNQLDGHMREREGKHVDQRDAFNRNGEREVFD